MGNMHQLRTEGGDTTHQKYFHEYIDSYHKGCERYGVWWKLFTFSMFAIAAVFIVFAIILIVFFL